MAISEFLGIWGASLATLTWVVKGLSWIRDLKSKVHVELRQGDAYDPATMKSTALVVLKLINRSPYAVTVTGIFLEEPRRWLRRHRDFIMVSGSAVPLPLDLKPHSSIDLEMPAKLAVHLAGKRAKALASISIGETFSSKPIRFTAPALPPPQRPPAGSG